MEGLGSRIVRDQARDGSSEVAKVTVQAHGVKWEIQTTDPFGVFMDLRRQLQHDGGVASISPGRMVWLPRDSAIEVVGDDVDPAEWIRSGRITGGAEPIQNVIDRLES